MTSVMEFTRIVFTGWGEHVLIQNETAAVTHCVSSAGLAKVHAVQLLIIQLS